MFKNTNSVTLSQNSVLQNFGDVKNEVFEKKIAFFMLEKKKQKKEKHGKGQKNPIKIVFLKVVIQKC